MLTGEIAQDWSYTNVVPIFRKINRSKPWHYRPVGLTWIVRKVMEGIIKNNITKHLHGGINVINISQHGFTKGRLCIMNLLEFLEDAYESLDEGGGCDIPGFCKSI